jgi:hypothetical protein
MESVKVWTLTTALNKQRCHEIDSSFMPLAFESFGAVSEQTVALMANLVSKAAELSMIPYSVLLSYWRKHISTTLQIHNARYPHDVYYSDPTQERGPTRGGV